MTKPSVEDYLNQGIYGPKEINPDERRKFLGTLRERVVIALTQAQVREENVYHEVIDAMKSNPKAKLLLNGNMEYPTLSKYIKLCNKYKVKYSIVTNKDHQSELGLVLAHEFAVDKKDIYVHQKKVQFEKSTSSGKKGFLSKISGVFKNSSKKGGS